MTWSLQDDSVGLDAVSHLCASSNVLGMGRINAGLVFALDLPRPLPELL